MADVFSIEELIRKASHNTQKLQSVSRLLQVAKQKEIRLQKGSHPADVVNNEFDAIQSLMDDAEDIATYAAATLDAVNFDDFALVLTPQPKHTIERFEFYADGSHNLKVTSAVLNTMFSDYFTYGDHVFIRNAQDRRLNGYYTVFAFTYPNELCLGSSTSAGHGIESGTTVTDTKAEIVLRVRYVAP